MRIVFLHKPISFSPGVLPVALPMDNDISPYPGESGLLVHHETNYTYHATLYGYNETVYQHSQCIRHHPTALYNKAFCADAKAPCGIGGEGVIFLSAGKKVVMGVRSMMQKCYPYTYPNLFAKVSFYRDWIRIVTGL